MPAAALLSVFLCLPPWRHCKTTLLQCGWGPWAGYDVSSSPWQYFGVDYLFSLAVCWFAESPLLIPPLLRLGSVGVLSSVPVALVIAGSARWGCWSNPRGAHTPGGSNSQTKISDSPHCEKKIRHAPKFVCRSAKDLLSTKGSAPVRESPSEECRVVRVFFGRCRCSGSYCQGTHQQRRSDRRRSCLKAQRWMRLGSTRSSSWRECQQAAHGTRGSSSGNRQMDQ